LAVSEKGLSKDRRVIAAAFTSLRDLSLQELPDEPLKKQMDSRNRPLHVHKYVDDLFYIKSEQISEKEKEIVVKDWIW
jgi:hypothetical protein